MADGVWKGVYPTFVSKFFDLSSPPMRRGRNGGEAGKTESESHLLVLNIFQNIVQNIFP